MKRVISVFLIIVSLIYILPLSLSASAVYVFTDTVKGSWYEKAVAWANEMGIVYGVSDTEFAPNSNITREQMAVMLKAKPKNFEKYLTY